MTLKETLLVQLGSASKSKKQFEFSEVMDTAAIECHRSYRLQKAFIISVLYYQGA